ncbi:Tho1p [Lachancea thermotolerans CBS 6340]|uniref:KLTH0A04400p n=1 Tax=Lachancea thermotolerans (strain ATCC 56472 / CBS 6340 / NRRL Y-8284) TaxID=559295 RepID=C5DBP9_LACTC|nr:KLTH0A04400p [Lachancea thermotolerans CBS 6340]CAR21206.1 KLTH0A04400p [Lachancea thermotolerans CBS 6340]
MAPMAAYAKRTVPELRKELESRQLSHDGNKPDLIARLEAHDAAQAAVEPPTAATAQEEPAPEPEAQPETQPEAQPAPESAPEPAPESAPAQPAQEHQASPAPRKPSPEEAKALALADLELKLRRAKKFADDQSTIDSLQRQIARVHKFGVDPTTQLARDLGLGSGPASAAPKSANRPRSRRRKANPQSKSTKHARSN